MHSVRRDILVAPFSSIVRRQMRAIAVFSLLVALQVGAGGPDCASLLDNLRSEFQRRNPIVEYVQVIDTKPKHSQYWVLARGIRADRKFEGSFDDERFGLFVVDNTFGKVEEVIEILPTIRWADYDMWIESYSLDKVTIRGHGATYGDLKLEKVYELTE